MTLADQQAAKAAAEFGVTSNACPLVDPAQAEDGVVFVPTNKEGPNVPVFGSAEVASFNKIDWGVLSRVSVYDPLGEEYEFQTLYSPRQRVVHGPCIINFLSNFACYAMLARLTQWVRALEPIESCNARLIFLATGTPEQSLEFQQKFERTGMDFPGELYCDPTLEIYKAFNLKRGFFRTVVPPLTAGFAKFGAKNVKEGIKRRILDRHLIGDLWQMGGVFVVEGNHDDPHFRPGLLFAHADSNTVRTPSVFEILQSIGFDGNLVIRPDACLSDFNEKVKLIEGAERRAATPPNRSRGFSMKMSSGRISFASFSSESVPSR